MSQPFQPATADFLRDESRRTGHADAIVFPRTESEVLAALATALEKNLPVTLQGARTGVTAGAVPEGGLILNCSRMDCIRFEGESMRVQPGATLADIRAAVPSHLFFPPDPTETTATIGGMISCNASGALSYCYGPTRSHILALRIALPNGEILDLERGLDTASGFHFSSGKTSLELPPIPRPLVKNAAGYFVQKNMDLADLFIGAEGTLGVVTEALLQLLPLPVAIFGLMAFFPSTSAAVEFVNTIRDKHARLVALEFFDAHCLAFLRAHADELATRGIPPPPCPDGAVALYAEWHCRDAAEAEGDLLHAANLLREFGSDPDSAIIADTPRDIEKLKLFRHSIPEMVNATIDQRRKRHPGLVKLGTDMSVPDAHLSHALELYETTLAASGLDYLLFGHIGDNHIHVNILPRDPTDYETGRTLYAQWATQIIAWGGSISAEHGIGKLKRDLFRQMVGDTTLAHMRDIKKAFDPDARLNPGNIFEP